MNVNFFYDDIVHVPQSTIDSRINYGTEIGHTVFTVNWKSSITTVK